MDFVPATSKRTPYNFWRSLIPAPKMYNVLHCKISPSGLKWEKGWRHVQAAAAARLLGSSAPQFAGKEKILIRYAWNIWLLPHLTGTRAKIITGDVCCRLICTSRQDDGRQDPGGCGVMYDLTKQTSVEIKRPVRKRWDHVCVCANNLSCVTNSKYLKLMSIPDKCPSVCSELHNVSSQWLELFRVIRR